MSGQFSRRQFVAAVAASGAATAASAAPFSHEGKVILVHHVFFWLKEPENAAHVAALKKGLRSLASIPQVKQLLVGGPASTEQRSVVDNSYQVSELMHFNSLEDQAAYQSHPTHQAFVKDYSHLWSKVVVYDMLVDE